MTLTIITWVSLVVIPISIIVAIGNGGNENTYGWFVAACASFISFIVYGSLLFIVKSMNGESPSFERKHLFKFATMFIAVLMGLAMASCSKDDDDGGGNGGGGSSDNYYQYVGKWSGSAKSSTGGTWVLTIQLYANKTADFNLYFMGGASVNTVEKTTGEKVVYYDDSKTIYVHSEGDLYNVLRVVSISGNNMVLDFIDCTFNMERTPGTGGGEEDNGSTNDYIAIKAVKIQAVKLLSGEWSYSGSVVNMYKKKRFDGEIVLYTNSKSLVGLASINGDRKCGDTNVSGYTYTVLANVGLNSKTYYYFN